MLNVVPTFEGTDSEHNIKKNTNGLKCQLSYKALGLNVVVYVQFKSSNLKAICNDLAS